jgi:hypothetical protein
MNTKRVFMHCRLLVFTLLMVSLWPACARADVEAGEVAY